MEATKDIPGTPDIIYANPCKSRLGLLEAVCKGVRLVTFDNEMEVQKCAAISKSIQLVLRIITDDRGSQCRLSSKFGAPRNKWRLLLAAAQKQGLQVVGVSFHVGSGCRDASRYDAALKDAREVFDMAGEYGMKMHLLDIGGGFPGETHSMWNPADLDPNVKEDDDDSAKVGSPAGSENDDGDGDHFMYFTEIAQQVAPLIDSLFDSSVRVIAEPGRYFVAACATLCCSVIAARTNQVDASFCPEPINDKEAAASLSGLTREEEGEMVRQRGMSLSDADADNILTTIHEELADYTKLYANQQLAQQEVDVYNDALDLYEEGFESATNLLGPPDADQLHKKVHTVEGMTYSMANLDDDTDPSGLLTLAAAGEAAINGVVLQAVANSAPLQDDFAYYINDGVYGGFNSIMFDHATVRPRILGHAEKIVATEEDGYLTLQHSGPSADDGNRSLYASTVFGPTCDSIDVIARSVLLPKLKVGDFLYFQNMGAYTMAAASSFNGFTPSDKFYVCSVQPDFFDALIKGPGSAEFESEYEAGSEEKKEVEV